MTTYHSNPTLKSVTPDYKGNIKINGRFEASEVPSEAVQAFHEMEGKIAGKLKALAIGEAFYLNE